MEYTPQRFAAFDAKVNITLFNAAILLAAKTTDATKKLHDFYHEMSGHIWFDRQDVSLNLENLGLRYFGELLERYEEKLGADVRNLRALALAMAYATPILTESMFVAKQKDNFLEKVHAAQSNDLYLFAASALMADEEEKGEYRAQLLAFPYDATEEIIFVLSILGDDESFAALNAQLLHLLGKGRTLSALDCISPYGWLLQHRWNVIRANKRKDGLLLRALLSLAPARIKEGSSAWKTLVEAGYGRQEILLMNAAFQWEPHLYAFRLQTLRGIAGERIAVGCILASFGAEKRPCDQVLNFCSWLIEKYYHFDVKLDQYDRIEDLLNDRLVTVCPDTVIWMVKNISYCLNYRFDLLDSRWDKLASELPDEKYHKLYRDQLLCMSNSPDSELLAALRKYEALTGKTYASIFLSYVEQEQSLFDLHVRLGLIDLFSFLNAHLDDKTDHCHYSARQYVWCAAKGVQSTAAFRFWEQYFRVYSPQMLQTHFFRGALFHEAFLTRTSYYYRRNDDLNLSCQRDFLTRDQQRELIEWIDASVFACKPEQYNAYALAFLKCDAVFDWYDMSELRPIFDDFCAADPNSHELRLIRNRFMSEDELEAAQRAEQEQQRVAAEQAKEAERQMLQESLDAKFDGTLRSLHDFVDSVRWRDDKRKMCLPMVLEKLSHAFSAIPAAPDEQCALLMLCKHFLKDGFLGWKAVVNLLKAPVQNCAEMGEEGSTAC